MGMEFKIQMEAGVIFAVAKGEIGAADLLDFRNRYTGDPLYHPKLTQLVDGRSAKFSFSGEEARSLTNWDKQNRPTSKTAIVIGKEALGWARMFVGWRGETHKIFHDMPSAREWLGLPSEVDS